jgi:hypothetical protein
MLEDASTIDVEPREDNTVHVSIVVRCLRLGILSCTERFQKLLVFDSLFLRPGHCLPYLEPGEVEEAQRVVLVALARLYY